MESRRREGGERAERGRGWRREGGKRGKREREVERVERETQEREAGGRQRGRRERGWVGVRGRERGRRMKEERGRSLSWLSVTYGRVMILPLS